MGEILVAYYSRSGVTEGLARRLAERLGADLDGVRPNVNYAGGAALCAVLDSLLRRTPKIEFAKNPADYRLVVVCAPVWAAKLAGPMRSYVKQNHARNGDWAGLWTSGSGSPYPAVGEEIAALAGRVLLASASVQDAEATKDAGTQKLEAFARSIGERP